MTNNFCKEQVGAGLYVDLENLQGSGQEVLEELFREWPSAIPRLTRLSLFVRADQVELWKLWATSRCPGLNVEVSGTQHFSLSAAKNSADIALATKAMADLLVHRISYVVVMSDDSDFISLYVSIRDEPQVPKAEMGVPFLWIVTDRESSLSPTVERFFPMSHLHLVKTKQILAGSTPHSRSTPSPSDGIATDLPTGTTWQEMALAFVQEIDAGTFKSTDCQSIVKRRWPQHNLAKASGATFGSEFKNNVWPILESWGVKIGNPGQKPIRYEMTEVAKSRLQ